MTELHYCKKCGRIVYAHTDYKYNPNYKCDCCGSSTYPVPDKYLLEGDLIVNEQKKLLREELVKTSPDFDPYLFDNREKILQEKSSGVKVNFYKENGEIKARVEGSAFNQPKCPTCGSTNVQKITGLERGISVATLGLFSKNPNPQNSNIKSIVL